MKKTGNQLRADGMLLLVTLFWGVSYLLVDLSLEEIQPFTLNALRFLIAFFVAFLFFFPTLRKVNRVTLKYSVLIGAMLTLVYFGTNFAVMYTRLSNVGFLCALTVVVTPLLAFIVKKERPSKKFAFCVLLALVGIGFLTLKGRLIPAVGDFFAILCAVSYAVDLLITETAVKKEEVNAFHLGVYQLLFTGLFNLILSLAFEKPSLPETPKIWAAVLVLSIFCTGLSFIVQTVAQQYTSASHVGVIFAMEPVFAGIVAYYFAGDVLSVQEYLGAALLMASLFIMEINPKGKKAVAENGVTAEEIADEVKSDKKSDGFS